MTLALNGSTSIPYFEYNVINELMHSHVEEFGSALRAIIAFGPLVTGQDTLDIEMLEVVDQWSGPDLLPFGQHEQSADPRQADPTFFVNRGFREPLAA